MLVWVGLRVCVCVVCVMCAICVPCVPADPVPVRPCVCVFVCVFVCHGGVAVWSQCFRLMMVCLPTPRSGRKRDHRWLVKRGAKRESWKRRWCVIQEQTLYYYEDTPVEVRRSLRVCLRVPDRVLVAACECCNTGS